MRSKKKLMLALWIYLHLSWCVGCGKSDVTPVSSNNAAIESSFTEQWNNVVAGIRDEVKIETQAVTDDVFAKMQPTVGLTTLILDDGRISDDSLRTIGECSEIQHLRLRMSPITDDGMREIAKLTKLRILNIPHSECSAAGIDCLRELKNLRQLRLGSTVASGDICAAIRELSTLTAVHLIDIPVGDDDLMELAKLPNLHSLYLDGGEITDAGWSRLFEARPGLHVHVNNQHHDSDPHMDHE